MTTTRTPHVVTTVATAMITTTLRRGVVRMSVLEVLDGLEALDGLEVLDSLEVVKVLFDRKRAHKVKVVEKNRRECLTTVLTGTI
jgi:hypothetical protein